ncbi:MAG TPA: hypothetical protein VKT72_07370 [Candidatus Baltobacteraceae bacterium]|nr:hypothetical protein [Candidatus Baltobacteraceae bacterium]
MPDVLTAESLNLSNVLTNPTNIIVAHLAQNSSAMLDDAAQLSDLVECNFSGYAPVPITNPDCFETGDPLQGQAVSDPIVFSADAHLAGAQMATSVYLTWQVGDGAPSLFRVIRFTQPFIFDVPNRILQFQIRFQSFDDTVTMPDLGVPGQD